MTFAAPLGLLALLAIPAIVAIHLFRRRFPVRPVAGLFLWQIGRQTPEAGRTIDRLPITTSLGRHRNDGRRGARTDSGSVERWW